MNFNIEHLGFAAALCTTSAFVPQVVKVWRERGAPGISTGMYVLFVVGVALWFSYGLALNSWPMTIANGLTLLLSASVLAMKWYFEHTGRKAPGQ
jgi:MtN3 and saliva related transmembrane protein